MTKDTTMPSDEELIERLAAIEHQRWADWQKWCHKVLRDNNPSPEIGDVLERWDRQIETTYAELSESEKQADRDQVMRYWPLLQEVLHEAEVRARIAELKSLPFRDQENGCMNCMAASIVDNRIATLTAEKEGKE